MKNKIFSPSQTTQNLLKFTQIYPNYPKWSDFQWLISREIEFFGENRWLSLLGNYQAHVNLKYGVNESVEFWEISKFRKIHSKITPIWSDLPEKWSVELSWGGLGSFLRVGGLERMLGSHAARGFYSTASLVISVGRIIGSLQITPIWSDFCGIMDISKTWVFRTNPYRSVVNHVDAHSIPNCQVNESVEFF